MNIMLYVNSFLPAIGGRELVIHYLAQSLQELGHQVRVVGPAGWRRNRHLRFSYPVHRWPTLRGLFPEQVGYLHLSADVAIWGCDIIHAHNTYPTGYLAARMKKNGKKIPLVITPHGMDIHVIPELGHGLRLDPELEPKIRFAIQNADLLTVISNSIRASLLDAGADAKKIRSVPNGVDIERFARPTGLNVFHAYGLPAGAKIIVTVGRYKPRKGHESIIHAMPRVLAEEPSARLIIIGEGTGALEPLISKLSLQGKVILAGGLKPPAIVSGKNSAGQAGESHDVLAAIHQASWVYVSAGVNEGAEGLSLAVLEAMAAGLPVVATDISGNRDVVKNGENGYLVPPADSESMACKLLDILKNQALQTELGRNARSFVERYHWREIAKQYLEVYEEARQISGV